MTTEQFNRLKAAFDEACQTTPPMRVLALLLNARSIDEPPAISPSVKLAKNLIKAKEELDSPRFDFMSPETKAVHLENIIIRHGYYPRRPR